MYIRILFLLTVFLNLGFSTATSAAMAVIEHVALKALRQEDIQQQLNRAKGGDCLDIYDTVTALNNCKGGSLCGKETRIKVCGWVAQSPMNSSIINDPEAVKEFNSACPENPLKASISGKVTSKVSSSCYATARAKRAKS